MSPRRIALGVSVLGVVLVVQGLWIPLKAELAQRLIERAWVGGRAGEGRVAPWPWADTHPVARLRMPRLGLDLIVLAGASGRTLAFGPGLWEPGAAPGEDDNIVIAGHRDTHFRSLRDVAAGDEIWIDDPSGGSRRYVVEEIQVLDERAGYVMERTGRPELTLITCFPFDAVVPGGPLRFVVRASAQARTQPSESLALAPGILHGLDVRPND